MKCPKCTGQLENKAVGTLHIDQCFGCKGIWFDKGELDQYLQDKLTSLDSPSLGKQLDDSLNSKIGKCPRCQIPLGPSRHPQAAEVMVESCASCKGFWLDSTEIDHIEKSVAKGNVTGYLSGILSMLRGK